MQLFFNFGEKYFVSALFLLVTEQQLNALTNQFVGETALAAAALGAGSTRSWRQLMFDTIRLLITQLIDLRLHLRLIKQMDLVNVFLAAGSKLLDLAQLQKFLEQSDVTFLLLDVVVALFDVSVALLDLALTLLQFTIFCTKLLLKILHKIEQFSGR